MRRRRAPAPLGGPFLRRITMNAEEVDRTRYPFSIRAFAGGIDIGCPERYFQHLFAPDDEEGSGPRKR